MMIARLERKDDFTFYLSFIFSTVFLTRINRIIVRCFRLLLFYFTRCVSKNGALFCK